MSWDWGVHCLLVLGWQAWWNMGCQARLQGLMYCKGKVAIMRQPSQQGRVRSRQMGWRVLKGQQQGWQWCKLMVLSMLPKLQRSLTMLLMSMLPKLLQL